MVAELVWTGYVWMGGWVSRCRVGSLSCISAHVFLVSSRDWRVIFPENGCIIRCSRAVTGTPGHF